MWNETGLFIKILLKYAKTKACMWTVYMDSIIIPDFRSGIYITTKNDQSKPLVSVIFVVVGVPYDQSRILVGRGEVRIIGMPDRIPKTL